MRNINIRDYGLETEVRRVLGKESGAITENGVLSIECIGLKEMKDGTGDSVYVSKPEMGYITDISDISLFTNLRRLYLPVRGRDIPPLSRLKKLEYLELDCGSDVDISVLAELSALKELHIRFNGGTGIPELRVLGSLPKLKSLCLSHFYASLDLTFLENLSGIEILSVSTDKLYRTDAVNSLFNLRRLHISAKSVDFVPDFSNCEKLEKLSLSIDTLSDISSVKNLDNLQSLDIERGRGYDLAPLSGLHKLRSLSIYSDSVRSVEDISELTGLSALHLAGFLIDDIRWIIRLHRLENLIIVKCGITDIKALSELTLLKNLSLIGNQIMDVSPLIGLKELRCLDLQYNQIKDISALSSLKKLETLNLTNNCISDISVLSKLPLLCDVSLGKNKIKDYSPVSEIKVVYK